MMMPGSFPEILRGWGVALVALALGVSGGCLPVEAPEQVHPGQIYVTSNPSGARVVCNRDMEAHTPANLQVPPGQHLLVITRPGYEERRVTVVVRPGERIPLDLTLEPVRGLLLLHSRPPGADVEIDDVHHGKTPLFMPNLPLGQHRVRFSLPGFFPRVLEVDVPDRTPLRVVAQLDSAAARLQVDSKPKGADVVLNNAVIGQTPYRFQQLGAGEHVLEIRQEGYVTYREEFSIKSGEQKRVDVSLMPLPGTLSVVTVPSGARIYLDGQYRGESPYRNAGMEAGKHVVSAELRGFATGVSTGVVQQGAETIIELRLERNSGTLLVSTEPPGVTVFLNGQEQGVTAEKGDEPVSEQLVLDLVPAGEHVVQFARHGYFDVSQKRAVTPGQTVVLHQRLSRRPVAFEPNVIIRTGVGPEHTFRGMLRERFDNGDVKIELDPGIFKTFRAADIIEMERIRR